MPTVTAKKTCCKDKPRCTKRLVTCMRLEREGYAERETKRKYQVEKKIPKKVPNAAGPADRTSRVSRRWSGARDAR